MLAIHDRTTVWMQNLATHVGRIVRRKKDETRCDFLRLAGPTEGHVRAEDLNFFCRKSGWNERRPNWAGRDAVHPNTFVSKRLRERTRE